MVEYLWEGKVLRKEAAEEEEKFFFSTSLPLLSSITVPQDINASSETAFYLDKHEHRC